MIEGINLFKSSSASGAHKKAQVNKADNPLISFANKNTNKTTNKTQIENEVKDEKEKQAKTDAQQLNEDAVYLASVYAGLQNGEEWAIEAARTLKVGDDPDSDDDSSNAKIQRSNNELALAIKAQVDSDGAEG